MAAPGDAMTAAKTPIARGGELAFSGFQKYLFTAARLHPREYSLFEDQLARFSIWASGIGVFASGRASTDHRLREVPDVQYAVTSLLEDVTSGMQECSIVLERIISSQKEPSNYSPTVVDANLARSVEVVADEISMLYRLSNTIRRASRETQNLKAGIPYNTIDDDEDSTLREIYVNHIQDRFTSMQNNLCQRLASAMVVRRRRILYRRSRYGYSGIRPEGNIAQPQIQLPQNQHQSSNVLETAQASQPVTDLAPAKSAPQSQAPSATTLSSKAYNNASTPSVISSPNTIAPGRHEDLSFPSPPDEIIRSRFRTLEKQRREDHEKFVASFSGSEMSSERHDQISEAEDKLRIDLKQGWIECCKAIPELTCPYCLYALPSNSVCDDQKWKAHVISDLDAYVCLFDDCDKPAELYRHSSDWLNHMRGHTLRWRCRSKLHSSQTFCTRDQYLGHMKESHPQSLNDRQLKALADRNARPIEPMFKNCPMCGKSEMVNNLEAHIVGHLRALALKSLPPHEYEVPDSFVEQEEASDAPLSRSTIKQDPERHSPLVFDEHRTDGSPEQTSRQDEWGFAINLWAVESEDIENGGVVQSTLKHEWDNEEVLQKPVEQEDASDGQLSMLSAGPTIEEDLERYSPLDFEDHGPKAFSDQSGRQEDQSGQLDDWRFATGSRTVRSEDTDNDHIYKSIMENKQDNEEILRDETEGSQIPSISLSLGSAGKVEDNIRRDDGDEIEGAKAEHLQQKVQLQEDVLPSEIPEALSRGTSLSRFMELIGINKKFKTNTDETGWNTIVQHRYETADVLIKCLNDFGYTDYKINDRNRPGIQIWLPENGRLTQEQIQRIHVAYVEAHKLRLENAEVEAQRLRLENTEDEEEYYTGD